MRFGVLGPLAVWDAEGKPIRVSGAKVRALLADLLLHEGRPVPADRLIDDLWGDEMPGNPTGALQAKVSQLRRALEQAEPGGRARVESRPSGYALRADGEDLDTARFTALAARARDGADLRSRAELLASALELFRGPVCAEFADEEFVRTAAAEWDEKRVTAIEELAETRLDLGEHRLLVGELDPLVSRHPLRERLRAAHIRALYRSGRQSEALDAFARLRDHLRAELGLDPGPELLRLQQAILEQDPELQAVEPAAAVRPRTNLSADVLTEPFAGLIGREEDGAELRARLDAGRLVTLAGPGGVGKTRLAVETAAQAADGFPDGVWLVELAARNPGPGAVEALADAVASTLGIREDAALGVPHGELRFGLVDRLTAALSGKRPLLILDNCEHLIEPVAELAGLLLGSVPGMRILATSREPLGLADELVYAVPPLDSPPQGADLADLGDNPAVRLFATRASAASPGFALDAHTAPAVASVCRRLDGIPLALELAATRVRALGVHELAARLGDRFRVLTAGHRNAPARQQTLRAMIDWSWELLPGPERAVLRRLAVHADGCTLAAAEEVCADDDTQPTEVLDLLARLVDRSLVTAVDTAGGSGATPTVRYRLLESVAAYCLERLEDAGELDDARRRHAEYYIRLAESAEPHLRGHRQREWLGRLDAEAGNLRAALDTAVQTPCAAMALRLVNAMAWYWFLRGRHEQAGRSLRAALDVGADAPASARAAAMAWSAGVAVLTDEAGSAPQSRHALELYDRIDDPRGRARAQWLLAFSRSGAGDLAGSVRLVAEALTAFRDNADKWGIAAALSTRAEHALVQGDLVTARQDSQASAALFDELGDRWGLTYAAQPQGMLAEIAGDYELAARVHRRSLRTAEELGLWPSVSTQLAKLGRLSLLAGDITGADDLHEKARTLAMEQGSGSGEAFAVTGLALGARRRNRLDTAEEHLRWLLDWNRRVDYRPGTALVLAERGFVAELRGETETAAALHTEGLAAAEQTDDPRAVALALEGLAGAAALACHPQRAARLLGAAADRRESVDAPLPAAERGDVDRITEAARTALGAEAFEAHFERGRQAGSDGAEPSMPE